MEERRHRIWNDCGKRFRPNRRSNRRRVTHECQRHTLLQRRRWQHWPGAMEERWHDRRHAIDQGYRASAEWHDADWLGSVWVYRRERRDLLRGQRYYQWPGAME